MDLPIQAVLLDHPVAANPTSFSLPVSPSLSQDARCLEACRVHRVLFQLDLLSSSLPNVAAGGVSKWLWCCIGYLFAGEGS